ncbi:MAG: hypothetical protein NC390_04035 [Fusobacterium sp.]|nr:hypothetical protein [Fusobacterium sp.]
MKKLFTFFCCILMLSLSANATNWVEVSKGTYIDTDSIIQGKQITIYWDKELRVGTFEGLLNKKISKIISKNMVYCGSRLVKMLESYVYDEQENLIRSYTFYDIPNKHSIVPDSVGETAFNFVCQYGNTNFNLK